MPELATLAASWAKALVGVEVSGTVTNPETGDSRDYRLLCTRVSYSGFGDRIAIVWDDKLTGGHRRWERRAEDLKGLTAQDLADTLEAGVRTKLNAELIESQYEGLAGEEL